MISRSSSRLARFGVSSFSLLAVLTLGSCVEDQDLLIVERAVWFPDPENCVLDSGSSDTVYPMLVDASFAGEAAIGLIVTNAMTEQSPGSNSGIDDTEIVVETAEVTLSFSGGGIPGGSFEQALPSNSISGGSSDVFIVRIPTSVMESVRTTMQGSNSIHETLEMEVVFKGHRSQYGDRKLGAIEARPYTYPFDICLGCLATCIECGDDGTIVCPTTELYASTCGFPQFGPVTGVCSPVGP